MNTISYKLDLGRLIKNTIINTLKSEAFSEDILCEVFDSGGIFSSNVRIVFKSEDKNKLNSFEIDVDNYLNRFCRR